MITISWIIERLLVKPTEGSYTDVVITADWRCNGSQGQYSGTCYGSTSFAPPSGSFTPYPDLTEAQVLGWCYANGVDQAAIEANVTQQINDQINPPVIAPPLPWGDGVVDGTTIQAPVIAPPAPDLSEPPAPAVLQDASN
jgi:hypothetical protein